MWCRFAALAFLCAGSAISMPTPLGFIENIGQFPTPVRYYIPLDRGLFYITERGYGYVCYQLPQGGSKTISAARFELYAVSRSVPTIEAVAQKPFILHYYRGEHSLHGVRVFDQIHVRNIFQGIDAVFYLTSSGKLKCDYRVSPKTNPTAIAFQVVGAQPTVSPEGKLRFHTAVGTVTEGKPFSLSGERTIHTAYRVDKDTIRFAFHAPFNGNHPLIVDPEIEWTSFAGGTGSDQIAHVKIDNSRNIVVIGRTQSLDFPTKLGFSSSLRGDYDAFVAKYSPTGSLLWATYYGGSRKEIHNLDHSAIAVSPSGSILIAGCTQSDDLPVTPNAFQRAKASSLPAGYDVFIAEFSSSGQLQWATYCGGNDNEDVFGITLDRQGNTYLVGHTSSDVIPVTAPATAVVNPKPTKSQDVFVFKLSPNRTPLWVFFIGGSSFEYATGVVADASGGIYVCGYTQSANFPTYGSAIYQPIKTAGNDGYVLKLDGLGRLLWCTFIGGNGEDYCSTIAIDSSFDRRVLVGGTTASSDMWYRSVEGSHLNGSSDGFLAALDPRNGSAHWVQYHGGYSADELTAIAIDPDNNIFITGRTLGDYPTKNGLQTVYRGGGGDMFVAKLTSSGITQWATYLGGSFLDRATDIAVDGSTSFVVVGFSASNDFPTIGSSEQQRLANPPGIDDGILVRFCNIVTPVAEIIGTRQFCFGETRTLRAQSSSAGVEYDLYQWEVNGNPIPGATEKYYTLPATLNPGTYRFVCKVTNSTRCSATTDTITIRIHPRPVITQRQFATCTGDPIRLDSIEVTGVPPFQYQWFGDPPPSDPTIRNPIVYPSQSTTYRLVVTDANGCTAEQSFSVLVLPVSEVPITILGKRSFCEGDSVILEIPNNLGRIRWSTGHTNYRLVVRTSGSYYATLTLPSGCEGYTDTIEVTVHKHPVPTITYDGSVLTTTHEYDQYQWFLNSNPIAGATNRSYEPQTPGLYSVSVDSLGCSGTSSPLNVIFTAQTHVTVGSAQAAIGERVRIPILLQVPPHLAKTGASQVEIRLRYNTSVLFLLPPSPSPLYSITTTPPDNNQTAIIAISSTAIKRDTLANLEFITLWGNTTSTELRVESVRWNAPTISTSWTNGLIEIHGHCVAGATRLYDDTGTFGIQLVTPNPATDVITIVVTAIEDSPHTLALYSRDGRIIDLMEVHLRAGTYVISRELHSYAPGYYFLVFRSLSLSSSLPVVIIR